MPAGLGCTAGNTCPGQSDGPWKGWEVQVLGLNQGRGVRDVAPLILCPAPALPPRCLHCQQLKLPSCQQTIETYLGAWQSPAKLHPGPASCQGSLCLPRLCSAARARLPFPSRLLQAAISHTGRTRVPSVLHVPAMPHTQGHGSCPSQPAKLSARNAMCTTATWVSCPTVPCAGCRSHGVHACCVWIASSVCTGCSLLRVFG